MKTDLKLAVKSILPFYTNMEEFKKFLLKRINWTPKDSTVERYIKLFKMDKL